MSILALLAEGDATKPILLPAFPDLLWGTVSFLILLVMFSKFILPTLNKVLAERAEKIEGGLRRAEEAQAEAAKALSEYNSQLAEARQEAASIRTAAADEKRHMVDAAKAEAAAEATGVLKRGQEALAAERSQASAELTRQIGALALDLAGKVVGESLSDNARARAVVDKFIADLERQAAEAGR